MAFDFTKLIAEEQRKQEAASNQGGGTGFKTVYPFNNGRLELKLIANEPSGLIYRQVYFHQYYADGKKNKVPCLHQMYGLDCPICNAVRNVQDKLNDDKVFGTYGYKTQGFMFAKLISYSPENYFGDNRNPPKQGEVVIFMFPKSVINELSNLITEYRDDIENVVANNTTRNVTLKINTGANGFPEYIFYVKNNQDTLCVDSNGNPDQDAFNKYMMNMPDIRSVKYPDKPDENMMKIHRTIVEEINTKYFGVPASAPQMPDPQPMVTSTFVQTQPVQAQIIQTAKPDMSIEEPVNMVVEQSKSEEVSFEDPRGAKPPCWGNNQYDDKCAACPWDSDCI